MKYRLYLAKMHAQNPNALREIFGPDGTFANAPYFSGPVWDPLFEGWADLPPAAWVNGEPTEEVLRMALDLRVRGVFLKVSEKCARALMGDSECSAEGEGVGWRVEWNGYCWILTNGVWNYKWPGDGTPYARAFKGIPVVPGAPWESPEHFLAELALVLAPKIGGLALQAQGDLK